MPRDRGLALHALPELLDNYYIILIEFLSFNWLFMVT